MEAVTRLGETAAGPLDGIVEEFLAAKRRRAPITPEQMAARYPEHAAVILDLFPALEELEAAGSLGGVSAVAVPTVELSGEAPRRLGDFRILREIGRGGMGCVYEAVQESLGRRVALKVLPAHFQASPAHRERFRREAHCAALLHHTNIVPVFGVGEADSTCFYAMQYIDGQPLSAVLAEVARQRSRTTDGNLSPTVTFATPFREESTRTNSNMGKLDSFPNNATLAGVEEPSASSAVMSDLLGGRRAHYFRAIARLGFQAATGIEHAHRMRILHRDVKPSNLLLDARGNLWVTDFGLAKAFDDRDLTNAGDIVGSIRYMAPERFHGHCDAMSDVYSLGVTLYECLTLRPPFDGGDRAQIMSAIHNGNAVLPRRLDPSFPRDLETIVLKAMAREPRDRYATAGDLADDLRCFLEDRTVKARRTTVVERLVRWRRRNPMVANLVGAVAALAVMLLVGLGFMASWLQERRLQKELGSERHFNALVESARATRLSRQMGQRFKTMELLREAGTIRNDPKLLGEAIAALTCVDVVTERFWPLPSDATGCVCDDEHRRVAISNQNGDIRVVWLDGSRTIGTLPGSGIASQPWRFSPDGKHLVSSFDVGRSQNKTVTVWDLESTKPLLSLSSVVNSETTPDGKHLAAIRGAEILVVEFATGKEISRTPFSGAATLLALRSDLRQAVLGAGRNLRLIEIPSGNIVRTIIAPADLLEIQLSHDGRLLAGGCYDYRGYIWETESGWTRAILQGHNAEISGVIFSCRGDLVATRSWDMQSKIWDPLTGRLLMSVQGTIRGFGPGDASIYLTEPSQIHFMRLANGNEIAALVGHSPLFRGPNPHKHPFDMAFSKDGRILASLGADGVRLNDVETGRTLAAAAVPGTNWVAFGPKGDSFYTAGSRGFAVWPIARGVEANPANPRLRIGPPRHIRSVGHSSAALLAENGSRVALFTPQPATKDSTYSVLIVELASEQRRAKFDVRMSDPSFAALDPDGNLLAGKSGDDLVIWRTDTGAPVVKIAHPERAMAAFSPNGRCLVVRSPRKLTIYDARILARIDTKSCEQVRAHSDFAMDEDYLLYAASSNRRVLWHLAHQKAVAEFQLTDDVIKPGKMLLNMRSMRVASLLPEMRMIQVWNLGRILNQLAEYNLEVTLPGIQMNGTDDSKVAPLSVELDPGPADSWLWPVSGSPEKTIEAMRRRLACDGDDVDAWHWLGHAQFTKNDHAAALRSFTEAIRLNPNEAHYYAWRAACFAWMKKPADAQNDRLRSLELDPNQPALAQHAAWVLVAGAPAGRDPQRAKSLARRALDDQPQNALYWRTMGAAHFRLNEFAEARAALKKSRGINETEFGVEGLLFQALTLAALDERSAAQAAKNAAESKLAGAKSKPSALVVELQKALTERLNRTSVIPAKTNE